MKILSVRLQNLNSLVDEVFLDFTSPPFDSSGIFAIVGPTGSGKTTILDAICLALYGRTPRLERISQATNEIMTRQASECKAEVVFETNRNGRFLCRWQQQRTRAGSQNPFGPAKHWIMEPDEKEWKAMNNTPGQVPGIVEEKTGMNFDQFTRSMMLAQGEFTRFLDSSDKERGAILKKITGKEIYGKISIAVHERNKEEKNKLSAIRERMAGVTLLEKDVEAEIREKLKEFEIEAERVRSRLELIRTAKLTLERINHLRKESVRLETEWNEFEISQRAFLPRANQLGEARKAREIETSYEKYRLLALQLDTANNSLSEAERRIPQAEASLTETRQVETAAMEKRDATKKRQEQEALAIREARKHDERIRYFGEEIAKLKLRIRQSKNVVSRHTTAIESLKLDLEKLFPRGSFDETERQLQEQRKETQTILGGRQSGEIVSNQQELSGLVTVWEKLVTDLGLSLAILDAERQWTEQRLQAEQESMKICSIMESKNPELSEAECNVRSLRSRLSVFPENFSFEEARKFLEDGKECPLCGSLEHPFVSNDAAEPSPIAQELETAEQIRDELKKTLGDLEVELGHQTNKIKQAETELQKTTQRKDELGKEIAGRMAVLELDEIPSKETATDRIGEIRVEIASLSQAIAAVDQSRSEENRLNKILQEGLELNGKIESEKALLERCLKELNSLESELAELNGSLQEIVDRRTACFGEKNPDDVEKLLVEDIAKAERFLTAAQNARMSAETSLVEVRQRRESARQNRETTERLLQETNNAYREELLQSGFESEAAFLEARLDAETFHRLDEQEKSLLRLQQTLETLRLRNAEELAQTLEMVAKTADPMYSRTLEELSVEQETLENRHQEILKETGKLQEQIRNNEEARNTYDAIHQELCKQDEACKLWYAMDRLIGSSDGSVFQEFAQGLTFRTMIMHANHQLQKMTDRYILTQSDPVEKPLELAIIDTYQADAMRTTKNLSGGESFLVSLALALGLSAMSSNRVRVDSLFLDEGFGTLDDQTLDTALGVLESLRAEGKQIGIISHVKKIRERIPVQILLVRTRIGESRVETVLGPF